MQTQQTYYLEQEGQDERACMHLQHLQRVNISGAGEMAQRVASSLCKEEDYSSDPQRLYECQRDTVAHLQHQQRRRSQWAGGRAGAVRNKLARLAKSVISGLK